VRHSKQIAHINALRESKGMTPWPSSTGQGDAFDTFGELRSPTNRGYSPLFEIVRVGDLNCLGMEKSLPRNNRIKLFKINDLRALPVHFCVSPAYSFGCVSLDCLGPIKSDASKASLSWGAPMNQRGIGTLGERMPSCPAAPADALLNVKQYE